MELSRAHLEALPESQRQPVLEKLGAELTSRVLGAPDFDSEVGDIISEMRARGHDLRLFDSDGEWQLWCGDWTEPGGGGGKLILHFDPVRGCRSQLEQAGRIGVFEQGRHLTTACTRPDSA